MFQRQQMQSLCYGKDAQQDRVVYEAVLSSTAQVHPEARDSFRQVSSTTFTLAASIESDESNNKQFNAFPSIKLINVLIRFQVPNLQGNPAEDSI
jgi:hypothetical protein